MGQTMSVVPAKWGTETLTYRKSDFGSKLTIVPAKFSNGEEVITTKAESAKWTMSDKAPDCESNDPNDCRYWCYKAIPAQYVTVKTTLLASDAVMNRVPGCNQADGSDPDCGQGTYTKKIVVTPATTIVKDIPKVTKLIKKTVMVTPPTTVTIEIPAVTKVVKRTVMVTPPTTRTIDIPEETKVIKKVVMVTPPTTRVIDIPAKFKTFKRVVMSTAPTTVVKDIIAVDKSFKVTNITAETTEVVPIAPVNKTFNRTVMAETPQAVPTDIAEKTTALKQTVLVKDASVTEDLVAAKHKTVTKEVLVSKGGLTTWKEVECELIVYSPLPINWNLGSATLTSKARSIINNRLMPVLKQGVAIEIASHTDSRSSFEYNQDLSERRAQAVVNYLMSKGINSSRLVAKGYGETRLTNRCSDGVTCTEREHLANRRTEFRVINQ